MGSILSLQADFCRQVEELYTARKDTTYMEVIIDLCERHGIEPEAAAKLLTKPLKERIKVEGQRANILKKGSKLF
jgi:Phage late-transcription coactivator